MSFQLIDYRGCRFLFAITPLSITLFAMPRFRAPPFSFRRVISLMIIFSFRFFDVAVISPAAAASPPL